MRNVFNGILPPLAIRADTADFERGLKKAAQSAKRFKELARKVREMNKPSAQPLELEAFLRMWKGLNRHA